MRDPSIFDSAENTASISQLLNPQKIGDFTIPHCKAIRNKLLTSLQEQFRHETNINKIISLNTCTIDKLLKKVWELYEFPTHSAALIAIGGYGRRELFPESDIDLMIVLDKGINQKINLKVKAFWTFLWDTNLPIAQSVRTIKDCVNEAKQDVTVMTSLMEFYYLAGDKKLFNQIPKIVNSNKIWPSKKFFTEKVKELENRHHKYSDTANHLEPNVKESPGGLRDLHTLQWLTNRHFKTKCIEELAPKGFLTSGELLSLQKAYETLANIRFALHLHTQRNEERLLFDYQYDVASLLGFNNDERNLQVEEFMQVFYQTTNQVSTLVELLIKRLRTKVFPTFLKRRAKTINERFHMRGNQIEATHADIFTRSPTSILELFQLLQQHRNLSGPSDGLVRLLLDHLHLIDDKFRNNKENRNLFISILNQPQTNSREIRRMAQLGVLNKYWPSFGMVTGRMQFDLYHIYTVEEHTLRVFENVCQFRTANVEGEFSVYHDIFTQIPKALLLYLAALFHDIAKGRKGDHSVLGAEEARAFCLQHDFSKFDANLVAWLVKNHLIMSTTAQHRDIDDPEVVKQFAENVGSLTRLNYLYLLTIADIRGTNPKLWNNWRSTLLSQLYQSTSKYLRRGLGSPIKREELISEVKEAALQKLAAQKIERDRCLTFWQELEEDYFLRHSDEEMVRHILAIFTHQGSNSDVIVNIHQYSARGATEIFIYCNDRNYLFAHITSALTRLGLVIAHAIIITSKKGHALDTFLVLDADGNPISDKDQCASVTKTITEVIENPSDIVTSPKQKLPRKIRELQVPIEIKFDKSANNIYTTLELKAPDFPGLLACVGSAFVNCNIATHNARISKLGERVHNIFQISNLENEPLNARQQIELKTAIHQSLQKPQQTLPATHEGLSN